MEVGELRIATSGLLSSDVGDVFIIVNIYRTPNQEGGVESVDVYMGDTGVSQFWLKSYIEQHSHALT